MKTNGFAKRFHFIVVSHKGFLKVVALFALMPFLTTAVGCSGASHGTLPQLDHHRSAASLTNGGCNADTGCPTPGDGGPTPRPGGYYANVHAVPDSAQLNVTIQNAMVFDQGDPIELTVYQPNAFSDATVQAVNQNTGQVLLSSTVTAAAAASWLGCKGVASCVGQWIRDWIISKGLDWIWDHRHDLACTTRIPAYGTCPGDITQWMPATNPPPGYYWLPTTFNFNPGYGWIPYNKTIQPGDPMNPDGRPARGQCSTDPTSTNYCPPPASANPDGSGQPVIPQK